MIGPDGIMNRNALSGGFGTAPGSPEFSMRESALIKKLRQSFARFYRIRHNRTVEYVYAECL